jgi:hypothetical protein
LKLQCDEPLSKVAFNDNVRRYSMVERCTAAARGRDGAVGAALQAERDAVVWFHSDPRGLSAAVLHLRVRAGVEAERPRG